LTVPIHQDFDVNSSLSLDPTVNDAVSKCDSCLAAKAPAKAEKQAADKHHASVRYGPMRKLLIVALILIAAAVGWYKWSFPTISYRYRLTVAVEADGQVHSGSSVIETRYRFNPEWAIGLSNGVQYHPTVTGQAVFIDLGARGALIAALGGDYDATTSDLLVSRAYEPADLRRRGRGVPITQKSIEEISQKSGAVGLTPDNLPAFYWFSNPADLASEKLVEPDQFASVIGDSTRLISAQIEITHDPVVIDIDRNLTACALPVSSPKYKHSCRIFIARGDD
jgi:hypothetical protein